MGAPEELARDLPEGSLGRALVERGLVTRTQLEYALGRQAEPPYPRLGEVVLAEGWVGEADLRELLAEQGKLVVACPACGLRYNLHGKLEGLLSRRCPRCDGDLVEAEAGLSVADSTDGLDPLPPEPKPGGPSCGRYQVLGELGRGRLGVVHLAWDPERERRVALRVLAAPVAARVSPEVLGEVAASARRLRHPALVPLLDHGRDEDGRVYLVAERVRGRPLDRLSGAADPLAPGEAARLVRDAARALHAVHELGLAHGGLRPQDLLVSRSGRVRVTDAGLGALLEPGGGDGAAYAAPERLAGRTPPPGDAASDVYALGAVLYYALTGVPPFAGPPAEVVVAATRLPPRPPSQLAGGLPPELEAVCRRCLAKTPAARFPTALALADALDAAAAAEPAPAGRGGGCALPALALLAGALAGWLA